ncbi:MAG: hypothetical protein GXO57_06045 [Thermodesulfobacteria bacterium]|nr:hypothetical protein [Thermodesulfobacteriota bacterium]
MECSAFLLFPQTLLFPEYEKSLEKISSSIVVLNLIYTESRWKALFSENLLKRVKFLNLFKLLEKSFPVDVEELKKELELVKNWGTSFRDPENLRYFSQFKDTLREVLESLTPSISLKVKPKVENIKPFLIALCLAEDFDFEASEVYLSVKNLKDRYQEVFKDKVIGEDLVFSPEEVPKGFLETDLSKVYAFDFFQVYGLNTRVSAWKKLFPKIELPFDKLGLLITDEALLENWEEELELKEEETYFKLFKATNNLGSVLGFSKNTVLEVIFLKING